MQTYDLIIIGGGPGGYETATIAAKQGRNVLLIERSMLGGTCLNRGCIPTKCLCAAASHIMEISEAKEFGISVSDIQASYSKASERAFRIVETLREGIEQLLAKVTVINAEASLGPDRTVIANEEQYTASEIIIATGSKPANLRVAGAEYAIDSDTFLSLAELPESLCIIGGGVIGLEFASIASAYGTHVTVLEFCPEILPTFDRDIASRLKNALKRRGIEIICSAQVDRIDPDRTVHYTRKGKENTISTDAVLAAVGRRAVVPNGCQEAGIAITEKGFINIDAQMQTSVPGIFAIGDVNGRCMLAHVASSQGKAVLRHEEPSTIIPSVVFTYPECAMVGTPNDNDVCIKIPYSSNGKALAEGKENGLLKLSADSATHRITSCSAIGAHAADLIAEATIAIQMGLTTDDLAERCIHAHPGINELLAEAASRL